VTIELIVPKLMPEATNAVADMELSQRVSVDVSEGDTLSNTKAGIVKCWSLLLTLQRKGTTLSTLPGI